MSSHLREIRINPVVPSESVLVATERGMRPKKAEAPAPRDAGSRVDACPFCRGNEHMTPPAIRSYQGSDGWQIRIVENLYPVLGDDHERDGYSFGLQQAIEGYGRHEVIIDHHNHGITLHRMSESHLVLLLHVYQERMRQLYDSDSRLRYILVFKNFGPAAGASIAHTHSQLIAMPVIPENVSSEIYSSHQFFAERNRCIFCVLIDEALTFEATIYQRTSGRVTRRIDVGQYIVERGKKFVAIKPFASRYEWEVHIFPVAHEADFLSTNATDLKDLARVVKRTMVRLDAVLGGVQYNYFLHSLPHGNGSDTYHDSYHWHLEICPRTSIPTGFELGSGVFVNTVSPESAAQRLRDVPLTAD